MTREKVKDLLSTMQSVYTNYNPKDKTMAINAWVATLKDYDEKQVTMAFKEYMKLNTSGFAPVPGQLVEIIHSMKDSEVLNETQAWALVSKAIRNSIYESVEEFAKLPTLVQRAVGLPEQLRVWALDENYNETVVSSQFVRCYREIATKHKEYLKVSGEVRRLIDKVNENSEVAQIEQKQEWMIGAIRERKQEQAALLEMKPKGIPMPK